MKPVCVPCQRFFRPKRNGYYFTEGMPIGSNAPAGTEAPDRWKPYKIWAGDLYECEGCGAQIVSGFSREPISEHYKPNFEDDRRALCADQLTVNDC